MLRKSVGAFLATLVLVGYALAADREVTGKVVKVDAAKKTISVQTDDGKADFMVGTTTKVLDAKGGALKDGLKALSPGTTVTLLLPMTGSMIKELKIGGPDKVAKKDGATKETKKDGSKEVKKDAPAKEPREVKGTPAKVLKVDAGMGVASVELEGGKKMELKLGEDVKYIGPRGGISQEGIKDDRFVAGAEVHIVMDASGKKVTEIHLPYRKSDKGDKDKGKKKDK